MVISSALGWLKHNSLLGFFGLAFGISWSIWLPLVVMQAFLPFSVIANLVWIGGFAPTIAAIILAGVNSGRVGIRRLLGRVLQGPVGVYWYAFALFGTAAIGLMAIGLHVLFGGVALVIDLSRWFLVFPVFLSAMIAGPLAEEFGWRGYALPRLQTNRSALVASLIIGVVWSLWHLPVFWLEGLIYIGLTFEQRIIWFLLLIAVAILFTWLYNNTDGSMLIAVLYHTAFNSTLYLMPVLMGKLGLLNLALTWVVTIIVIAVFEPTYLSRKLLVETD